LAQPPASKLEAAVRPIAQAHRGTCAVAVKHLGTGEGYAYDGDRVMQTASLIKLAVMATAYKLADDGKLDLRKLVALTNDDRVPGAGILTDHFSDGATLSVRDLIRLMIRYSDNTATNMVLDQFGLKAVNDYTAARGLPETRINGKVFKGTKTTLDPDRLKKYQLGSTSPNETVRLLELIHTNQAASLEACGAMLAHLKANDDREQLVRFLPESLVVAHKTGATNRVRTDAGILYIPDPSDKKMLQPVAVCVLTGDNSDTRWVLDNEGQVTIAKVGLAVYDHFRGNK
jgi:beta-lactamase class A